MKIQRWDSGKLKWHCLSVDKHMHRACPRRVTFTMAVPASLRVDGAIACEEKGEKILSQAGGMISIVPF